MDCPFNCGKQGMNARGLSTHVAKCKVGRKQEEDSARAAEQRLHEQARQRAAAEHLAAERAAVEHAEAERATGDFEPEVIRATNCDRLCANVLNRCSCRW